MSRSQYVQTANKEDSIKKIVDALEKKTVKRNGIIPFPEVNCVLGRVFHFNYEARHHVLYELNKQQLIELIPYHGIRILKSGRSACHEDKEVEA